MHGTFAGFSFRFVSFAERTVTVTTAKTSRSRSFWSSRFVAFGRLGALGCNVVAMLHSNSNSDTTTPRPPTIPIQLPPPTFPWPLWALNIWPYYEHLNLLLFVCIQLNTKAMKLVLSICHNKIVIANCWGFFILFIFVLFLYPSLVACRYRWDNSFDLGNDCLFAFVVFDL